MSQYFYPVLVFAFMIFYVVFGMERIRKLQNTHNTKTDQTLITKCFRVNFNFSLFCIFGVFFTCACYVLFPKFYVYFYPLESLDISLINSIGMFMIKNSFIWLIVSGFRVLELLSALFNPVGARKTFKIEMLSILGVTMLSLGMFLFISSLVSLLFFVISVISACVFIRNYRISKKDLNQDQTIGV